MADVHHSERATDEGHAGSGREPGHGPLGLVRDRLTARLLDPASYRVGWVVAPAGSGKSRLLAHLAASYEGPMAWCDAPDPVPRTETALVAWLTGAIVAAGGLQHGADTPTTVDSLVASAAPASLPLIVVLDDVHLLEGSEAEAALAALVARLPATWRLVMASRMNLGIDLSRLRVSGQVVDIGPDELRFRTWEVEELFRDVYHEPLLPEDVAALTRRTAGWAAYLQMFFLATSRRPLADRRLVLGTLQHRTRLVSEYLARHVLAGLEPALQDFLIRTSALRRPSGRLSDEFLGWEQGSAEYLAELERRQVFTERLADDSYRYHAVLLSYLDAKLVETVGLSAAKEEHRRAGRLLEREGWREEALAAYARSEDWEGLARVLGNASSGQVPFDDAWADALPPSVLESDPLLLMAQARRALAKGALEEAAAILRRAEGVAASAAVARRCRDQREEILAWSENDRPAPPGWAGLIRKASQRQPAEARRAAASLPGITGRFAEAVAAFLAGDISGCSRALRSVTGHPDAPPPVVVGSVYLAALCGSLLGRPVAADTATRLQEEVEASGVRWLSRLVRAGLQDAGVTGDEAVDDLVGACDREGDRWGAAVITAIGGFRRLYRGDPEAVQALERASEAFRGLGAGTLESSLLAYAGVAALMAGRRDAAAAHATRARSLGAALEVPVASAVGTLVIGALAGEPETEAAAREVLEPLGTWPWHAGLLGPESDPPLPADAAESTVPRSVPATVSSDAAESKAAPNGALPTDATPGDVVSTNGHKGALVPAKLVCLGRYHLEIGGRPVDDAGAKPMERALLHLLSIRAGAAVHRETLVAALWPDADPDAGLHRLQVAVSSLRRLLAATGVDGSEVLARSGDSYKLRLPDGAEVDVLRFEQAVNAAGAARAAGDRAGERAALEQAFELYSGPLLPGDGPVEWVVDPRRWLVGLYCDVAARLASLLLDEDDPRQAMRTSRAALSSDRYRDDLWKLLIDAAERAGSHAEAEQGRRDYEAVLNDLGV